MADRLIPLKKYGQNFLKDGNIIRKIIDEIKPAKDETILEIGPGEGALTEYLVKGCTNFYTIEIDPRAIEHLRIKFESLRILEGNFLKTDLLKLFPGNHKIRIAGNIPYNITKAIIIKLLDNRELLQDAVLMVQHEVAEKLTSSAGDDDYGVLAVLMNYFTETKICFTVPPTVFYPKPKVSSAVIHITFKPECRLEQNFDNELFIKLVNSAFANRRKTLKNSLSNSIFGHYDLSLSGIDLSGRAEQMSVTDFIKLTRAVLEQRK